MAGPPTHVVMVKKKESRAPATVVGVAWADKEKGWFSIKLNPCTILTDRDDIYINIYPNREREEPLPEEPPGWLEGPPE